MDRLSALSRGTQVMLAASVLLLVDTLLPWQKVTVELGVTSASASASAWNGFWGVVLGLLVVATVAWLVARIAGVDLPLPVSDTLVAAALGALVLLFAAVKVLSDSYSTVWAVIGLLLAIAVAVGAYLRVQEGGGMAVLQTEVSERRQPQAAAPADPSPPTDAPPTTPPGAPPAAPPPPSGPGT